VRVWVVIWLSSLGLDHKVQSSPRPAPPY